MPYCPKCGSEVQAGEKFCVDCGALVKSQVKGSVPSCPECGSELQTGEKFCPECGASVKSQAKGPRSKTRPVSQRVGRPTSEDEPEWKDCGDDNIYEEGEEAPGQEAPEDEVVSQKRSDNTRFAIYVGLMLFLLALAAFIYSLF